MACDQTIDVEQTKVVYINRTRTPSIGALLLSFKDRVDGVRVQNVGCPILELDEIDLA